MSQRKPPKSPVRYNPQHIDVAGTEKYLRSKTLRHMSRNIRPKGMGTDEQLKLIKQKLESLVRPARSSFPIKNTQNTQNTQYVQGNSRIFEVSDSDYNFKKTKKSLRKKSNRKSKKGKAKKSLRKKARKSR
jgi:hypothetical protein